MIFNSMQQKGMIFLDLLKDQDWIRVVRGSTICTHYRCLLFKSGKINLLRYYDESLVLYLDLESNRL